MSRRKLALDVGVAALVLGLSLGMLQKGGFGQPSPPGDRTLDAVGVLLAIASALPLVAWRYTPLAIFGVTAAASLMLHMLDYPLDVPFGPMVAAYMVALARGGSPLPQRWTAMLAVTAAFVPATALAYQVAGVNVLRIGPELLFWAVLFVGLWIAGDRERLRREQMAELEQRARRSEQEAERERQLAAAQERTRIARELHDSAGHAINVILVQASAARLLRERDPAGSGRAITTIEEVARSTIGEIDRLVRALREGDEPAFPTAGPAALEELVERYRTAGLAVTMDLHGEPRTLPPSVAWAVYRILQEALTNATRHGRGSADVAVCFQPRQVEITVTNPTASNGSGPGPGGHGIVGMRERVTVLGGRLEVEARQGAFRVHAALPSDGSI